MAGGTMVRKVEGLEQYGFVISEYVQRLKLLRMIVSGEKQGEFAARMGIDAKRWNNYELGYPIPREVALMLMHKLPGMSIEWLWIGRKDSLSLEYRRKIEAFEHLRLEQATAEAALLNGKPHRPKARSKK